MNSAGVCRNCTAGALALEAVVVAATATTTLPTDGGSFAYRYTSRGNLSDSCQFEIFFEASDETTRGAAAPPTTMAPATTAAPVTSSSPVHVFVVDWGNATTYEAGIHAYVTFSLDTS